MLRCTRGSRAAGAVTGVLAAGPVRPPQGDIAALHAGLKGGKWTPVTAVVDRFDMMTSSLAGEQVDLQSDLRFDGQVR